MEIGIPAESNFLPHALLNHFGSVAEIRAAGVDRLTEVAGIGPRLAEAVHTALTADTPADTVES